jgi:hypothetical protein
LPGKPWFKPHIGGALSQTVSIDQIALAKEIDRKVAVASVRFGELLIRGITVWQGPRGGLRVFLPSFKNGFTWEDHLVFPTELRAEIEANVIAAFKERRLEAKAHAPLSDNAPATGRS